MSGVFMHCYPRTVCAIRASNGEHMLGCLLEFGSALRNPVNSALLTSLLFMPAQALAPLQANNARSEELNGKPSDDRGWPRGTDQRRGRVVLVDEHRTTRVSSTVNGQQPCERQLNKRRATRPAGWKPPAEQVEQRLLRPAWSHQRDQPVRGMMWCPVVAPRKPPQAPRSSQAATPAAASEPGPSTPMPAKRSKRTKAEPAAEPTKGKGKAAKAKPAPQPGRWLDRDCNAALNMQRIGESKWRPLELCWWPEQGALPAKGKEYPGLGYKRLRDKPPKAQQQQQPAVAQSGLVSGPSSCPSKKAKAAPQPGRWLDRDRNAATGHATRGRWLDRDTNGCLNLQRIGESRQRPIELCRWDDLEALPPIGKEYQQRYKRVNDRLPKGRQWLRRAAEYRRGIDGASGSGQQVQGQGQAVKVVIAERRQVIKAALRCLVEAAQPDLSPAEVDAVVAEVNKRMTMGSKQCVLAAVMSLTVLLQSFLGQPTPGFPAAAGPAPGPPPPPDPAHPPYAHPRIPTRSSPRTAAAPAQLPPPVQLGIWDPQLLAQIRDAMELLTRASVIEHLMRGPHHHGIRLLPGEVAAFEQPSTAWPVAMLQQLHSYKLIPASVDEEHLTGDGNSLNANATTIITSIQEFYRHPGRFIRWWCKAVGVVVVVTLRRLVRYALFVNRSLEGWQAAHDTCPRPFTMLPMVGVRARHFVIDDRVLHGVLTDLGITTLTRSQLEADSLPHWQKFIQYSQLQNSGWEFARRVETDGVSISVHFVRSQAVTEPVELPFIGRKLTATSDYDPTTHIAVGVDPGVTQAIKAGHAQRDQVTGRVLRQWEWELSKGQLKHDSGLTKAKQNTTRWSAAIQPQLLQLAAATPAGTTLGGLHAHVLALKATWDALWEEYLKPRWRRQRLALHHAQERVIEAFCKKVVNGMKWVSRHHYHQDRGVAVFLGAGNFSQGGWKAGAVRAGFRKVVEQPSRPSTDPRPDRLVIVDEFRTSRVSSSVHARQPCELHLPPNQPRPADWVPPAGQVNPRLAPPPAPAQDPPAPAPAQAPPPPPPAQAPPAQAPPPAPPAQAQPLPAAPGPAPPPRAPPGGRWLDRDTNGCLNLQRIGESRQRPIELCRWDDLEALPPIGKEYQQRYKRVADLLNMAKAKVGGKQRYLKAALRADKDVSASKPSAPSAGPAPPKHLQRKIAQKVSFLERVVAHAPKLQKAGVQKRRKKVQSSSKALDSLSSLSTALEATQAAPQQVSRRPFGQGVKSSKTRLSLAASETQRMQAVLSHPVFAGNPFTAISRHLQTTLPPVSAPPIPKAKAGKQQSKGKLTPARRS
ncbi:hypothetical protein QJQ45_019290 [Haematococcus lacustris]|nr:hypothetical protein QJQ45_019290 [Haematococcus lacustris]